MSNLTLDLGGEERVSTMARFGGFENRYRYVLGRRWAPNGYQNAVCFVGLNPSTADEKTDDPTIRRMMGFAKSWGYGGIRVVNLFAYRATEPADMKHAIGPVGPGNDDTIKQYCACSRLVIACWGNHGGFQDRDRQVMKLIPPDRWRCLRTSKDGFPAHPLYLPGDCVPVEYAGRK